MKLIDKDVFLDKSRVALEQMMDNIASAKPVDIKSFDPKKSALIILDLVNGFLREGSLKSDRIESVVEPTVKLMRLCVSNGIPIIAFADCHSDEAVEFESYPAHCVRGTGEAELITEIAAEGSYHLIPKNSTNGYLEEEFQNWLQEHPEVTSFIIVGDCTDICVLQFALTLKAHFNKQDVRARLVVPLDAVETYDLGAHYGELMNIMALQIMSWNGIELTGRLS